MRNPSQTFIHVGIFWLAAVILAFPSHAAIAETVYKCVTDGKVSYTADPPSDNSQCQQTKIRDDGPKPADLARLLEEKKLREEEERKADEAFLMEREVRAKEIEAEAASRRARAAEEELLLLRQPQPSTPPVVGYPLTYPYWWGSPVPLPHPHPGFGLPGQPTHPNIPPKPKPVPPTGAVRVR